MNESSAKVHATIQDHLVSKESFQLLYDPEMEMLVTDPVPQDLAKYYESEAYISHTDSKKGLIPFLYQSVKSYSLHRKERLIRTENNKAGSLLDIGAGTADFLSLCKIRGWEISGVEINSGARELAAEKGVNLLQDLSEVEGTYDVITLWHVLEHLPNLKEITKRLEELLKPGGTLLIAVPNFNSFDATYYKEYWAAYDVPRHIWHFSRGSMKKLFSSSMKLKSMKPMIFDAFYVSLLSEKYKSGSSFSLKAFWIGLRSNYAAVLTKEYSSIIYVYKNT